MKRVLSTAISLELRTLISEANEAPVLIENCGKTVAIVLSPEIYSDLLQRAGGRRQFSRRALTLDSNELFGLHGDVFCNDGP